MWIIAATLYKCTIKCKLMSIKPEPMDEKECLRNERIVKIHSKWNLKGIVRGLRLRKKENM